MKIAARLAEHLRHVHFGGNWTAVNLKDRLGDIDWQQATTRIDSLHSIAELVFHMNYFVRAVSQVLSGGPLNASDKFSFDLPTIKSQRDWETLTDQTWTDAEELAGLIEALPDSRLSETFVEEMYGSYYRNIQGLIEHCHYHLGQIAIVQSLLSRSD